jgi:multiple sugar transport system ATP-binding protein
MSITLHNLTKSFGGSTRVVDNLSLEINDGEFVVLLGPSGCGKTTTLRMLAGLEKATSGEIFIDGELVNDLPPQRRDVAMVFQSYALYPHMTVAENIGYPLRVRKLGPDQITRQVRETATMLEIEPLLARKPRDLSGGERQRVALARAIVRHPRAFLMDEPLSNLDARLRLQMRGELKHLQHELGTTTVYVTHDQAEAMTLGHRVAVMNRGQLQQFDTPQNIYHQPANRFVAEFVGSPGMNFLDGEVDLRAGTFSADGITVALNDTQQATLSASGTAPLARRVTLGIRAEHIRISLNQADGWLPASVYVTELMGSETLVFVELGDEATGEKIVERIVARAAGDFRAETKSTVWIQLEAAKAHFFDPETGRRL